MKIVGQSTDGRSVVGELFIAHDTRGVPLSVSLTLLHASDYVPDLYGFYCDAVIAGWSPKSTVSRIREAVVDVYGFEYWQAVEQRLARLAQEHT